MATIAMEIGGAVFNALAYSGSNFDSLYSIKVKLWKKQRDTTQQWRNYNRLETVATKKNRKN